MYDFHVFFSLIYNVLLSGDVLKLSRLVLTCFHSTAFDQFKVLKYALINEQCEYY